MQVEKKWILITNKKPHRSKPIKLLLTWDSRIGEFVLRDEHFFFNTYSQETIEDMLKIIKRIKLNNKEK